MIGRSDDLSGQPRTLASTLIYGRLACPGSTAGARVIDR
jgi:hypothetical protein